MNSLIQTLSNDLPSIPHLDGNASPRNDAECEAGTKPLRLLHIEDTPADAELILHKLRDTGLAVDVRRVETARDFTAALADDPELILADYILPEFDALEALALLRESGKEIPFIIVSGTIGEETAVEALKLGAADCVNKDRLTRLAPAVRRALRDAAALRERRLAGQRIRILSRAVEHSPASIMITDSAGTIEYVNPKLVEITGYSAGELIGQNPRILRSGEMAPEGYEEMWRTLRAGNEWRGEFHNRRKNGERFWELASISAIRNESGSISHFVAVKEDITERKRLDAQLRDQARLLDLAQDAIIVRGFADHKVTYWNRGAEKLYGWKAEEVIGGMNCGLIFADPADVDCISEKLLQAGEWQGEQRQVKKDGGNVLISARATLLRAEDGTPQSVLIINTDITEQKQLETQFLRAQRMESVGALAAGIAHDLNNILSPIMMAVDILKAANPDESGRAVFNVLEESAQRGASLVKQVLGFARGVGERQPVDLKRITREIVNMIRETFPKSITVRSALARDLAMIQADPTQIHQVLLNLCVNARDAMPQGGRITIEARDVEILEEDPRLPTDRTPGAYVELTVSDTGTGMPREVIDRIFDPYFSTKEAGKGTGLGLATVALIVKSHDGFLTVRSEPCHGASFTIWLPATQAQAKDPSPRPRSMPEGKGELILIVDDEASIRGFETRLLNAKGYRTLEAASGVEALAQYMKSAGDIALVITDMTMPLLDGIMTVRALWEINPKLKIIGASGQASGAGEAEFRKIGVTDFLQKPFAPAELLELLREVLDRPQAANASASNAPAGPGSGSLERHT